MFKNITLNNNFIRFILVGILNTIVGYGLFSLFIYLGLHYSIAVIFSTILGVCFNFKSIGRLVFNSHNNEKIYRFISVYIIVYLLNISGLWIFSYAGLKNMYVAGAILLTPISIVSFILNSKFVFNTGGAYEKN